MRKPLVRILHVEDEPIQRKIVERHVATIDDYQFEIVPAESEDDAIAAVRKGEIDLVLLDYQLAEGDGLNCLKTLRGIDANLPVIAVSGTNSEDTITNLLEYGADDFLPKEELTRNSLTRVVQSALVRVEAFRRRSYLHEARYEAARGILMGLSDDFLSVLSDDMLQRCESLADLFTEDATLARRVERLRWAVEVETSRSQLSPMRAKLLQGFLRTVTNAASDSVAAEFTRREQPLAEARSPK